MNQIPGKIYIVKIDIDYFGKTKVLVHILDNNSYT